MLMSVRLPAYLVVAAAGVALAGCGSSSSGTHANTTKNAAQTAQPQIKAIWTEFFSPKTPAATKITLLQNGKQFAPIIQAQSKSAFASESSATVSAVKLKGPLTATVTYTVMLAGKPALKNTTGTAVKVGNSWLVSDASFCGLLKLEGSAPPGCPKA
jgi:hypothetical protein